MIAREHKMRIQNELRTAGVTLYGLMKDESRHLPNIIRLDEHIEAIAYGRYPQGSCMLVATDSRVVFLDKKPMFTFFDEIMYDIVSGVACSVQGYFAAVTLHTRFNDINIKYVNNNAARRFVRFIEKRRINKPDTDQGITPEITKQAPDNTTRLSDAEMAFLSSQKIGALSTTDKEGHVHGSVVQYYAENNQAIYILVKPDSTKAQNIFSYRRVALTVYDDSMQTLQIHGTAEIETDNNRKDHITAILMPKENKMHNEDSYHLIRIVPTEVKFSNHHLSEPSSL